MKRSLRLSMQPRAAAVVDGVAPQFARCIEINPERER
jgi:hypothetical protein